MLELVGFARDTAAAQGLVDRVGGIAYVNHPTESEKRPFSAMVRVGTDDIEAVRSVSDAGLYVCFSRVIKPLVGDAPADRSIATFGLVRNPAMTHRECDDHWRDKHGPLALKMHLAMCDYTQLSVVHTLGGDELDGIAMCAFATREDLSKRFFNDDDAKTAIIADVATFAHPSASPPRVVLQQMT